MERFAIVEHGCKVNRYDGETVRAALRGFGLAECAPPRASGAAGAIGTRPAVEDRGDDGAAADLLVVNACAVTDRAVRRGRQALRRLRRANPGARMIVTGCMTGTDEAAYAAVDPGVLLLPHRARAELEPRLQEFLGRAVEAGGAREPARFERRTRAFLKVQDGCDSHCAFCVIPAIRGAPRSRTRDAILREAQELIARGFGELVLCGIHLGHYGRDSGDDLPGLVDAVCALQGTFRVRLSSLEIGEAGPALVACLKAHAGRPDAHSGRLAPHLHLPMQSGDDSILRAMRRPYTVARYLERVAALRAALPALALTTDVIVGFPGESDAAFGNTLAAARAAEFGRIHVFPYSPRAGTEAARLPARIEAPVLRARVARLLELDAELRGRDDARRVGQVARVLIEASARRGEDDSSGLCERYRRVRVRGRHARRSFVDARITGVAGTGPARSDDALLAEVLA